jgi:hypothetical protein
MGLDIDSVETKAILTDYSVDSLVAHAANRSSGFRTVAAITHFQKEFDNQVLKELRRPTLHPSENLGCQISTNALIRLLKEFLGRRSLVLALVSLDCRGARGLWLNGTKLAKLFVALEKQNINALGILSEKLSSAVGDLKVRATWGVEQTRLVQKRFGPCDAVIEPALSAARQQLVSLIRR